MIVVAGAGRCGTSLMMQTLDLLGVPLLGNPRGRSCHQIWQTYFVKNNIQQNTVETTHNPKGYYELNHFEMLDLLDENYQDHFGKAVKFTAPEVVNLKDVEKVIFCRRKNLIEASESMQRLAQDDYNYAKQHGYHDCHCMQYANFTRTDWFLLMRDFNLKIENWLFRENIHYITIWFEDMLDKPKQTINKLKSFLNLNVDISAALKNVDTR